LLKSHQVELLDIGEKMQRNTFLAICALISGLGACAQSGNRVTSHQPVVITQPPHSTAMAVAEVIMPPQGYLEYCIRTPNECRQESAPSNHRQTLDAAHWADLEEVNATVNANVRYVTDARLYATNEYWAYPNGRGDCEDFALLKRKLLLQRGWGPESLLISVALDRDNLRHAVLIVATDQGDYVLDNQLQHVVAWADTGYKWQMRQTAANPNVWVSLTGDTEQAPFEAPAIIVASRSTPAADAVSVVHSSEETLSLDSSATASTSTPDVVAHAALQTPIPLARPQRAPVAIADALTRRNAEEIATAGVLLADAEKT